MASFGNRLVHKIVWSELLEPMVVCGNRLDRLIGEERAVSDVQLLEVGRIVNEILAALSSLS